MVGVLIAALLANAPVPAAAAAPAPLPAHPAMWVVRDEDTTIYLFGTFHALDGRSQWFTGGVRDAFDSSDELVLETLIPEQPRVASAPPVVQRRTTPMTSFKVAPGASFLASTRMAVAVSHDSGMEVSKGADMVLRDAARSEGKQVAGLETLEFQLDMFNRMAPVQPPSPSSAADPAAKAQLAAVMAEMQSAWGRGDQRIFTAMLGEMRRATPDNYRMMFPERNGRWAQWLAGRMQRPGTVFVAVGAGHFAGPDSVLSQLTLRGYVATRVN
jgi:uncharacterized protein YbaP (TraB family)